MDPSKHEVLTNLKMEPTGQNHSKFWCLVFTKLQFPEKGRNLVRFDFFFLKSAVFWHYLFLNRFVKNVKSLNLLKCSLLLANKLVIFLSKEWDSKDSRVLSFTTKY